MVASLWGKATVPHSLLSSPLHRHSLALCPAPAGPPYSSRAFRIRHLSRTQAACLRIRGQVAQEAPAYHADQTTKN